MFKTLKKDDDWRELWPGILVVSVPGEGGEEAVAHQDLTRVTGDDGPGLIRVLYQP